MLRRKGDAVATVTDSTSVRDAARELTRRGIGALVVSDDGRRIDGIISERDIVRGVAEHGAAVLDQPVSSLMTTEVLTCHPEDSVDSLMAVMTERRFRHLPVAADGCLAGIVSIGDVVNHRVEELALEARTLQDYLHAGR